MIIDWILGVGSFVFALTTWATLNFGYAYFRELGERDEAAASPPDLGEQPVAAPAARPVPDAEPALVDGGAASQGRPPVPVPPRGRRTSP